MFKNLNFDFWLILEHTGKVRPGYSENHLRGELARTKIKKTKPTGDLDLY